MQSIRPRLIVRGSSAGWTRWHCSPVFHSDFKSALTSSRFDLKQISLPTSDIKLTSE